MSVYVGIDVHRKRSQVPVIDQSREMLLSAMCPTGWSRSWAWSAACRRDRRPAFEVAFGGRLVEVLEGYRSTRTWCTRCSARRSPRRG
jgi:hypothetical protein